MNGRSTTPFEGFCTGIHRRTSGHYIVDQQNALIFQSLCPFILKSADYVTKPFFRCQICLRCGWTNSPEQTGPHRAPQSAAECMREYGRLVVPAFTPANMVKRNRDEQIEQTTGIFSLEAVMQPFRRIGSKP